MVKCGLKPELAENICETIEGHITAHRSRLDGEYNAKIEEAKKVCLEETEAYKRELAHRLQIFCEAKSQVIEQTVAKQQAIKETAALAKLKDILNLLEGVEPNGEPNGTLQAEYTKLQRRLRQVSEEKSRAITAMNRTNAIASKIMKRNRMLETKLKVPAPVVEAKTTPKRLDNGRKGVAPTTTRPTLNEHQDRRPQNRPRPRVDQFTPEGIAATMDADLI